VGSKCDSVQWAVTLLYTKGYMVSHEMAINRQKCELDVGKRETTAVEGTRTGGRRTVKREYSGAVSPRGESISGYNLDGS